jgi:hypothetical protein
MNRHSPSKAGLTRDILVDDGICTACLASSKAADSTLPRGTWRQPGRRLLPASPPNQVRRR